MSDSYRVHLDIHRADGKDNYLKKKIKEFLPKVRTLSKHKRDITKGNADKK